MPTERVSTFTRRLADRYRRRRCPRLRVEHDRLDDVLDQAGQPERLAKCHRDATGRRRAPRTVSTLSTVGPRLEDEPRRGRPRGCAWLSEPEGAGAVDAQPDTSIGGVIVAVAVESCTRVGDEVEFILLSLTSDLMTCHRRAMRRCAS
jgi:hypothetical protein